MKTTAVIVSRNDNYGGHLNERATYCFNSAIDTYDEVIYIDWNSETHSLLYDIRDNIEFKGNFKHFVITPEVATILTNRDPYAQKCCEVLARNIGIRRAEGEWIISTNIDIIHPPKDVLLNSIDGLSKDTFYTISRRPTDWDTIRDFHNGEIVFNEWRRLREHLILNSEERHFEEKTTAGDDYSIINCCGDYQIAHRNIWHEVRGMEEELIYSLFADTNVQKKAVVHGFGLKALFEPPLFHINHGRGGGGFLDGINKKTNDIQRAITNQTLTLNTTDWGFSNIDIEYETF